MVSVDWLVDKGAITVFDELQAFFFIRKLVPAAMLIDAMEFEECNDVRVYLNNLVANTFGLLHKSNERQLIAVELM